MHEVRAHFASVAAATGFVTLLATAPVKADAQNVPVEWGKFAAMLGSPLDMPHATALPSSRSPLDDGDLEPPQVRWMGRLPRLALVARDWASSRRVYGDLALTDELRPTQSIRMAVSRLRLAGGVFAPFAQLGVGEWRVDRTLLPSLPGAHDLAALSGIGFELTLSPLAAIAVEMDWTFLHANGDADVVALTHPTVWSTCLAARTRF